jgi:hypothetical protein
MVKSIFLFPKKKGVGSANNKPTLDLRVEEVKLQGVN